MPRLRIGLLTIGISLCTAPALGGLFEDIYRGLGILTTPIGGSGGSRFGRVVIVPNQLGKGYRLELDRTFGPDARGRPESFDAGNFEIDLSGSMLATLQYTSRGLPTGNADIFFNDLNYTVRTKTGAQDALLRGTLNSAQRIEINPLGFYSFQLDVSNENSVFNADGLLAEGEHDANFDIGPITIRGNVFLDATLALLSTFGLDTSELAGVFPASPIDQITDEIQAFLSETARVRGESLTRDLRDGPLSTAVALEAQEFVGDVIRAIDGPMASDLPASGQSGIPEPTSILLISLLGLASLRRRA